MKKNLLVFVLLFVAAVISACGKKPVIILAAFQGTWATNCYQDNAVYFDNRMVISGDSLQNVAGVYSDNTCSTVLNTQVVYQSKLVEKNANLASYNDTTSAHNVSVYANQLVTDTNEVYFRK